MGNITMSQAREWYRAGHSQGLGYTPYTDQPGANTIAKAVEAARRVDGWEIVLDREISGDVVLLRNPDGEFMVIGGDAFGNNAVAVDATAAMRRR